MKRLNTLLLVFLLTACSYPLRLHDRVYQENFRLIKDVSIITDVLIFENLPSEKALIDIPFNKNYSTRFTNRMKTLLSKQGLNITRTFSPSVGLLMEEHGSVKVIQTVADRDKNYNNLMYAETPLEISAVEHDPTLIEDISIRQWALEEAELQNLYKNSSSDLVYIFKIRGLKYSSGRAASKAFLSAIATLGTMYVKEQTIIIAEYWLFDRTRKKVLLYGSESIYDAEDLDSGNELAEQVISKIEKKNG